MRGSRSAILYSVVVTVGGVCFSIWRENTLLSPLTIGHKSNCCPPSMNLHCFVRPALRSRTSLAASTAANTQAARTNGMCMAGRRGLTFGWRLRQLPSVQVAWLVEIVQKYHASHQTEDEFTSTWVRGDISNIRRTVSQVTICAKRVNAYG